MFDTLHGAAAGAGAKETIKNRLEFFWKKIIFAWVFSCWIYLLRQGRESYLEGLSSSIYIA